MRKFRSEKRLNKIISVVNSRQQSLTVVLENIHDPHNVSAVFRTCDSAGIPEVNLIYTKEKFPGIGKKSSASAYKWVNKIKHTSVEACYDKLRKNGFKVYASALDENSTNLYDLDLTEKVAIVFGNEHRGVSKEASELADIKFRIPMFGMVQSLNISVAAAISIFEAVRQRIKKGLYKSSSLDESELEKLIDEWCSK